VTRGEDLKKEEIARIVLAILDEMERRFERTPRSFIYTLTKDGEFRRYR
jgi:hypothetical protein